jgi:RNA polymerase sigma-70 factor (ECF subfamily)
VADLTLPVREQEGAAQSRRVRVTGDADAEAADSSTWLAGARAGDEVAFAALYRHAQPRLLRYAITLVGTDAEDITAETWLQVARDLHTFKGDLDAFRGWAARIVRNRSVDHLRAGARRPVRPVDIECLLDRPGSSDTADEAVANISTAAAVALIAALPPDQAEAVVLRAVVGLDAKTAGKVLGKRAGAVRTAAHRGLRTLAQQLGEESGQEFGREEGSPRE